MTSTAQQIRSHAGPALFSFGFRPFFLFAAAWAALAVPLWTAAILFGDGRVGAAEGRDWHVHEMLFGYLGGVIAGFLLTAVPNWTGRLPVTGWRLAALFGLWAAGRGASLLALPPVAAAVIDSAFFIVFAAVISREVLAGRNRRNLPVCAMVSLLALANIAFHLRGWAPEAGPLAERGALAVAAGLIMLVGGRIVPSFTQNWLVQRGVAARPAPFGGFDRAVLIVTGVALAGWAVASPAPWTGALLIGAGMANLGRLWRWRGWTARAEALVWILHVGYLWLGAGLVLLGAAFAFPAAVPTTAGVHALTAGAIGVMTLAVMTRASLGHTGRPRAADGWTTAIYLAAIAGAAARILSPFIPALAMPLLGVSAVLWALAFGGFVVRYGPMLVTPKRGGG